MATGTPATVSAAATGSSRPPVASSTTRVGARGVSRVTSWAMPSSSLGTDQAARAPVGGSSARRMARSRRALATSMPTKQGDDGRAGCGRRTSQSGFPATRPCGYGLPVTDATLARASVRVRRATGNGDPRSPAVSGTRGLAVCRRRVAIATSPRYKGLMLVGFAVLPTLPPPLPICGWRGAFRSAAYVRRGDPLWSPGRRGGHRRQARPFSATKPSNRIGRFVITGTLARSGACRRGQGQRSESHVPTSRRPLTARR